MKPHCVLQLLQTAEQAMLFVLHNIRCCRSHVPLAMQDYRTAFFINCGAMTDVAELGISMDAAVRGNIRFVIIDSHRPIHHCFNDDNDQDNILLHAPDWGDVPLDAVPAADSTAQDTGVLLVLFDICCYQLKHVIFPHLRLHVNYQNLV